MSRHGLYSYITSVPFSLYGFILVRPTYYSQSHLQLYPRLAEMVGQAHGVRRMDATPNATMAGVMESSMASDPPLAPSPAEET